MDCWCPGWIPRFSTGSWRGPNPPSVPRSPSGLGACVASGTLHTFDDEIFSDTTAKICWFDGPYDVCGPPLNERLVGIHVLFLEECRVTLLVDEHQDFLLLACPEVEQN